MKIFFNILVFLTCMTVMPVNGSRISFSPNYHVMNVAHADSVLPLNEPAGKRNFISPGSKFRSSVHFMLNDIINSHVASKSVLGISSKGNKIEMYYFPGTSNEKALIIGGVHGSELSSIEVAKKLIDKLSAGEKTYYSVIVVPCLFPDNASHASSNTAAVGSVENIGRYSGKISADPNRQMPAPGKMYDPAIEEDYMGRKIEKENLLLLQLIDAYRPERIANLHAIREKSRAGVYADPRTNASGYALGFASDSTLAVDMATKILSDGGTAPGNFSTNKPAALYYKDPAIASNGKFQRRSFCGAKLPGNRGHGVSLGGWASTAVDDELHPEFNRPAIRLITVEFPGYKPSILYNDQTERAGCLKNINAFANSLFEVFLAR